MHVHVMPTTSDFGAAPPIVAPLTLTWLLGLSLAPWLLATVLVRAAGVRRREAQLVLYTPRRASRHHRRAAPVGSPPVSPTGAADDRSGGEGSLGRVHARSFDAWCDVPVTNDIVFPGSFNPLHVGHERMAAAAADLVKARGHGLRAVVRALLGTRVD